MKNEKTAPNTLAPTSERQSSIHNSIIANSDEKVKWVNDKVNVSESSVYGVVKEHTAHKIKQNQRR